MHKATAITPELNDLISYVAQNYDMRIYSDYSGRGMYGKTCFGLVFSGTPGQFFSAFLQCLEDEDIDIKQQLADLFDEMETDNLGWDKIYYFPGWSMEDEQDSDEDEE